MHKMSRKGSRCKQKHDLDQKKEEGRKEAKVWGRRRARPEKQSGGVTSMGKKAKRWRSVEGPFLESPVSSEERDAMIIQHISIYMDETEVRHNKKLLQEKIKTTTTYNCRDKHVPQENGGGTGSRVRHKED